MLTSRTGMRKLVALTWSLVLSCALIPRAHADTWILPGVETFTSADGAWRLTVTPRPLTSQADYFRDKVDGSAQPGGPSGSSQDRAVGLMEHRRDGEWQVVWQEPLSNDVAPVEVVVIPGGAAVTFDNWHSMGYGENVVVFHDDKGRIVRSLSLEDFLPKEFVAALPRSVSSLHWRGKPYLSADTGVLVVPVAVPDLERGMDNEETVEVHFDVGTGNVATRDAAAWRTAQDRAQQVARHQAAERAAAIAAFVAPLEAPRTAEVRDWHRYLMEAFWRLDPGWNDDYPATKVVPSRGADRFGHLADDVGDAMIDETDSEGVIMMGSPAQDVLLEVLRTQALRVPTGSLVGARIYVAVDDAHFPAARKALTPTGAQVIQLDVATPIPQRPERLRRMRESQQEGAD